MLQAVEVVLAERSSLPLSDQGKWKTGTAKKELLQVTHTLAADPTSKRTPVFNDIPAILDAGQGVVPREERSEEAKEATGLLKSGGRRLVA